MFDAGGLALLGLASIALGLTAFASMTFAQQAEFRMSPKRAAAVHACSMRMQKVPQPTWGNAQGHMFRTCMMEHGEQE